MFVSFHTLPPCYPRLVILPVFPLISFSLFNPLVFAVLRRFIVLQYIHGCTCVIQAVRNLLFQ